MSETGIFRGLALNIRNNNVNAVVNFLRRGGPFDVDTKYHINGDTLLHYAVYNKKPTIVSSLINSLNASKNIQNFHGKTAFFLACEFGFINIVKNVFLRDFDNHSVDSRQWIYNFIHIRDNGGYTPLLIAYKNHNIPVCKVLVEHGAKLDDVAHDGFAIVDRSPFWSSLIVFQGRSGAPGIVRTTRVPLLVPRRRRIRRILQRTVTLNEPTQISTPQNDTISPIIRSLSFSPLVSTSQVFNHSFSEPTPEPVSQSTDEKETPVFFIKEHIDMLVGLKKSCPICLEGYETDKVVIFKKCFHTSCSDCFQKIDKCHYCRIDIK